jgi:quercetin dioxygenase-like cupin family protein
MPVVREEDAVTHEVHGSRFTSYVSSRSAAGTQLCAWRLSVPAAQPGVSHTPDRDEVLLVLEGALLATVNGRKTPLTAGDVLLVRAGDVLTADGGPEGAAVWTTTTPGLTATMADGSTMAPPWAQ